MKNERRIVDNRVFLLDLDELYRESMKTHERKELLRCAQESAQALSTDIWTTQRYCQNMDSQYRQ